MLTPSEYHKLIDSVFSELTAKLETLDDTGEIELEANESVISVTLPTGKQYVINRHEASRQIWLSSPKSGAFRFSYNNGNWIASNGAIFSEIMKDEFGV